MQRTKSSLTAVLGISCLETFSVDNLTLENTCEDPNNDSMCALCVNNGIIVRLIVKICVRVLWQLKTKLGTRFSSDDKVTLEHHQEHPDKALESL